MHKTTYEYLLMFEDIHLHEDIQFCEIPYSWNNMDYMAMVCGSLG